MLPTRRNLRRQSLVNSTVSAVSNASYNPNGNSFLMHSGMKIASVPTPGYLAGSESVHRNPESTAIDANGSIDVMTRSSKVFLGGYIPRNMPNDTAEDYYDSLVDYSYDYSAFNAVPATLLADQWSAQDAATANYEYDHLYADTTKTFYSGETYVYDTVTSPLATTATYENYIYSSAWTEGLKEVISNRAAVSVGGKEPLASISTSNILQISNLAGSSGESLGFIDVFRHSSGCSFDWGRVEDVSDALGSGATVRAEVKGKWLQCIEVNGYQSGSLGLKARIQSSLFDSATRVVAISTDLAWEGDFQQTWIESVGVRVVIFCIRSTAAGVLFDDGHTSYLNELSCDSPLPGYTYYFGAFYTKDANDIPTEVLTDFVDAWTSGASFGDEEKRYHVDQASSTLYLGTTNTDFWYDGDYGWEKLNKYDPIALNDDLYLVNSLTHSDGYHKIELTQVVSAFLRGAGGVTDPAAGTYSRDVTDQTKLYISGEDAYGRTVDWASNNGSNVWVSADGDSWTEETSLVWEAFDAVGNKQVISGFTVDPLEAAYVAFSDPTLAPPAITEDYELNSLRIIPKPTLEDAARPLKGGEWEFVSSTRFRFSSQALKRDHDFPVSGSVFISDDGGSTYQEFFIDSVTESGDTLTVDWGAGSPVWVDSPKDIKLAYIDPSITAITPEKPLASFYFHTSDSSAADITSFVTTEDIQEEDYIKVNGTDYEVKGVYAQAGYVQFDVDADLSSITGGTPGAALVEFIHSEQPYTYFTRDGRKIDDGSIIECYLRAISEAPEYQWINPWTGLRETDPWGRKALRVRVSGGQVYTLPVQVAEQYTRRNTSVLAYAELIDSDGLSLEFNKKIPNNAPYSTIGLLTGLCQGNGLQEDGVRRHRVFGGDIELLDLKKPVHTSYDPYLDIASDSVAYNLALHTGPMIDKIWYGDGIGSIFYSSDTPNDQLFMSQQREVLDPLNKQTEDQDLILSGITQTQRHPGQSPVPEGYEWWDIYFSVNGYSLFTPEEWKSQKLPWLLTPGPTDDAIGAVIDFDAVSDKLDATDLGLFFPQEAPIVKDVNYFPFNVGGGNGGGDGGGGGGGSVRPDTGILYPRRFG